MIEQDGSDVGEEGCLSFPGIYGLVPRARTARVRYRDLDFREREIVLTGFVARVFLHELDHLDGNVFVDRMEPDSRRKIQDRLDDLQKLYEESPS